MILLFTDFGFEGPYVGQVKSVLADIVPGEPVIDLMHDAPAHEPRAAAYLLAALVDHLPVRAICLGVVDPGVGTARPAVALAADGRWFIGPGNGLFALVQRRASDSHLWQLEWPPAAQVSATFHGRDVFAPVAARLARGLKPPGRILMPEAVATMPGTAWPDDLHSVIYVDRFGNCMTGIRATTVAADAIVRAGGTAMARARTFSEVPAGSAFWYENSSGLLEIAVNRGSAAQRLGLSPGVAVSVLPPGRHVGSVP